jgi:site-specific DNA-methyltransferase (adenine-specific)
MMELNKIYCGDCLELMKELPDKSIDLVLTDPPYGINLKYDSYIDTEDNWFKLMKQALPEMIRIGKMVILPSCQIKRLKWIYDNFPPDWLICWYKGSTGHASYVGFNDWEPHLVYGRTKNRLYMHDYFQTKSSPKKGTFNHPCPKPIDCALWIIERSTEENDLILDPFIGSGTTAIACLETNRNFIGMELEPKYVDIANKRINDFTKQLTMAGV